MNYNYNFDNTKLENHEITIKNQSFFWPKLELGQLDTVLLKVVVADKLLHYFSMPYIEIKSINDSDKIYLERKNHGIRYINISNIINKINCGEKVTLTSNKLSIETKAELLIFHNSIPTTAKILVVSPHPDDAEIAAFGLYSNCNSHIITITAGEAGNADRYELCSDSLTRKHFEKGKFRTLDSITTPLIGNVPPANAINLGYFDSTLLEMYSNPEKAVSSNFAKISDINQYRKLNLSTMTPASSGKACWNNLVSDLKNILSEIKPNIIVTPHPILDKHRDHRLSTLALFQAINNNDVVDIKTGQFFFYINHSNHSHKYPYGPQHSTINVPPSFINLPIEHGVLSYPLSKRLQANKMFALNSMFDLREGVNHKCLLKKCLQQKIKRLFSKYNSITPWHGNYRKAIRANEFFLTSSFLQINNLICLTEALFR